MALAYRVMPVNLGGTAVKGCGTIHKSEILPTLVKLSEDLLLPHDLCNYIFGSTGKREYSGDIDIVIDESVYNGGVDMFFLNLKNKFGQENVARNSNMLHLRYPIVGYNQELIYAQPRTGYVQIDFSFGDVSWEKFYHYSDVVSSYKGAHRNLVISAICSVMQVEDMGNGEIDSFGRLSNVVRWKWGPKGLIRVHRRSKKNKDGAWAKKQDDENLTAPCLDPLIIAATLFPGTGTVRDLDSLESLMSAIKRNFLRNDIENIWKRCASNFLAWDQGPLFYYPTEIEQYISSNDK